MGNFFLSIQSYSVKPISLKRHQNRLEKHEELKPNSPYRACSKRVYGASSPCLLHKITMVFQNINYKFDSSFKKFFVAPVPAISISFCTMCFIFHLDKIRTNDSLAETTHISAAEGAPQPPLPRIRSNIMIDPKFIKEDIEGIRKLLAKRGT